MANLGYLQVTRRCNQQCRFCSNPDRDAEIDYKTGKAYIEKLRGEGYAGVLFTGGEPTLSEHLPRLIQYCDKKNYIRKLLTNGQKLADADYLDMLVNHGLDHVCISFHSCIPETQNILSQNPESFENIMRALTNLSGYSGMHVDILTTINRLNAGHLSSNVRFILKRFPFVNFFTWNNLDPRRNRTAQFPEVIPRLMDIELELKLAMDFLHRNRKPFQVERVPLCYMEGYEHLSTETRAIVLESKRMISFLDERGCMLWRDYMHGKGEACRVCTLEPICAGLHEMDTYYSSDELYPLFIDREKVIQRIQKTSGEMMAGAPVVKRKQARGA